MMQTKQFDGAGWVVKQQIANVQPIKVSGLRTMTYDSVLCCAAISKGRGQQNRLLFGADQAVLVVDPYAYQMTRNCRFSQRYADDNNPVDGIYTRSVAFTNSGKFFLSCHEDGGVHLTHAESGISRHDFYGHSDAVVSCSTFTEQSPFAGSFITGSTDGTVRVWDILSGKWERVIEPSSHRRGEEPRDVTCVFCLDDSPNCLIGYSDGLIAQHDLRTSAVGTAITHEQGVVSSFSQKHSSTLLATSWLGGMTHLWDIRMLGGAPMIKVENPPGALLVSRFSVDGQWLASSVVGTNQESAVSFYHVEQGKNMYQLCGHKHPVVDICFTDTSMITVAEKTIQVFTFA